MSNTEEKLAAELMFGIINQRLDEHERQIKLLIQEIRRLSTYVCYQPPEQDFIKLFPQSELFECRRCAQYVKIKDTFIHVCKK